MFLTKVISAIYVFAFFIIHCGASAQCPSFSNFSVSGNEAYMCEGDMLTVSLSGQNLTPGDLVEFYLGLGTFNPYNGEGIFIGSVEILSDVMIEDFVWIVPSNFCEEFGEEDWVATGIIDPPPTGSCAEIFTPYFDVPVSCPTMTLTGGGDVCEGNCPEDPNVIVFTITGDDLPFTADIEISASLFPTFDIDDLLINNGDQLNICLDGNFPSFDPTTNTLSIPTLAIGLSATVEIVSIVSASGCPVTMSSSSITLNFIEAATADAGPDQTICSFESVTLNGSIGGSATNSMWTTNGDGMFGNPSVLSTSYIPGPGDILNGNVELTLTATDPNGACIPAESNITITIEPAVIIDLGPPLTICNTDIADITASVSDPDVPGMWETTGDGIFGDPMDTTTTYQPGEDDLDNGSVTLIYAPVDPGICVESDPLEITFVEPPIVNVPQNIEVCSDDSITIHINVSGNFTDINWSTIGDGVILIINDMEINYTPGPQDINNQFTIVSVTVVSGFPECGQTTYNMPIDIVLCDCPPFETVPPPSLLCSESDTLDLSTLLVVGGPGAWSITNVPPGSNSATLTGTEFITNSSDGGTYTVTYTLDTIIPGCPTSSSEFVVVNTSYEPEAGANIANCGPSIVFVNGFTIPSGFPPIMWETLGDGTFVNPSALSTSYTPGPQDSNATQITLVLHLPDSVCGDKTDTTFILFPLPPEATFVDDTISVCNEAIKGSVVNFPSLITAGDMSGMWTNTSGLPVDFSNPANVNFDGIGSGFYNISYQTNSAMFPCQEANYTIVIRVEDCTCPLLEVQLLPSGLCNSLSQLNMDAFIIAGGPGSWQVVSMPPGSNPATLVGSNLQTLNADPGLYRLRFTFDAAPITACPDSAELDIEIQAAPTISISGDTLSCWLLPIQLNGVTGGSASGMMWSTSGLGSFNDTGISDPVYTPSIEDLNAANVTLYGITTDTFGFCDEDIDSIQIQLVHPPNTTWSSLSATICNNPDSGSVVDLFSYIVSGDGTGIWSDVNGSGVDLSNPSSVDFDGVSAGTYMFAYLTQTAVSPCTDSTYNFVVTVEDCFCPPFIFDTIASPVCAPVIIDLNALIIDAAPGIWSITGPAGATWPVLSFSSLITSNADDGIYNLSYKLIDSIDGCPATHTIPFVLESTPSVSFGDVDCDEASMTYSLAIATDAASANVDFGMLSETTPGNFIIEDIPSGQNLTIGVTSGSGSCSASFTFDAPDCSCTLETEDISDTIFICPGDTFVLIPFLTGAQGLAFSTWISGSTTLMRPTLPLYEANTWIWIVRDSAGCEQRDTFNVAVKELITIDVTINSPSCEGTANGSIILNDIDGGIGPYTVQLDNNPLFLANPPDTITGVGVGVHKLTIRNADGCETIKSLIVNDISIGSLELGPDVKIPFGDSTLIEPQVNGINVSQSIWDPAMINSGMSPFWYAPSSSTIVKLIVIDSLGCIYEDEMLITVLIDQKIYIPNIFSPNNDQINDILEIHISSNSYPLESLEIFDRWGNLVHRQIAPGPFTWDGFSHGKEVSSGVYIVKVIWKDEAGDSHMFVSDLTLIR